MGIFPSLDAPTTPNGIRIPTDVSGAVADRALCTHLQQRQHLTVT